MEYKLVYIGTNFTKIKIWLGDLIFEINMHSIMFLNADTINFLMGCWWN